MTATPGMSRRIKDALVTLLSGLQYGGEPAFIQVLDNTKDEFKGYPSIRVLPSTLSSTDGDSASRDHTVEYAAIMHFQLQSQTDVESDVYDQMYDRTDLIVNTLEHGDQENELNEIDSGIQDWIMSVPSANWYVGQSKAGALLLCNVIIRVTYSQFTA